MAELADAPDLKSGGVKPVPVQARLSAPYDAGWSSLVARRAHNPKVGGSNPPPATVKQGLDSFRPLFLPGKVAQLVRAHGSYPCGRRFDSDPC